MQIIADLHLHSKYSRAVSPQMVPPVMSAYGKRKGIDLLTTGDFTHPLWFREIRSYLTEDTEGIYKINKPEAGQEKTRFLLSVEIACIFSQGGKGRRIHNLVMVPSFEVAEKVNKAMLTRGFNLSSDGRPIIGLSSKHLLEMILEIDERCILIPCHVWTPWFGLYGMSSGFESLQESFEELSPYVYGIETGLSSDPEMNWQIKELDTRSILSFSDAHSPAKMGREATVFDLESLTYENIRQAIMMPSKKHVIPAKAGILKRVQDDIKNEVAYTIEFYPEEGKYHYSGHRNCNISFNPEEHKDGICPVCHKHVTDGVMRRVQELADQNRQSRIMNQGGIKWIFDKRNIHPPYVKIVPLNEIIAEAIGSPVASPKVKILFDTLTDALPSEMNVLLHAQLSDIEKVAGVKVAQGVQKVRAGNIVIKPGYDGVYGVVKIWPFDSAQGKKTKEQKEPKEEKKNAKQLGLQL